MSVITSPQTASGRVRTTTPLSADAYRYSFLSLSNAEPNLSLPLPASVSDVARYFLVSDPQVGVREWTDGSNGEVVSLSGNNFGIGTSTPNENLTVVGNISATGFIYGQLLTPAIPAAAGSNDMVQFHKSGYLEASPAFVFKPALSAIQVGTNCSTTGFGSSIAGGNGNFISNMLAFIGAGDQNTTNGAASNVVGGAFNTTSGDYSSILGGRNNTASNAFAVICGGLNNTNYSYGGIVLGGFDNAIDAGLDGGSVLGGHNNKISHDRCFVLGSDITTLSSDYTYIENLEVTGRIILNSSVAERYDTIAPLSNVLTIDLAKGTTFNVTLTSNVGAFNVINSLPNKANSFIMFIKQDGVGFKTVNWIFTAKTLKWPGASIPAVSPGPDQLDVLTFISNDGGATWHGFVGGQNFT